MPGREFSGTQGASYPPGSGVHQPPTLGLRNRPPHLERRLDPAVDHVLDVRDRLVVGGAVRCAAGELGDLGDVGLVLVAPVLKMRWLPRIRSSKPNAVSSVRRSLNRMFASKVLRSTFSSVFFFWRMRGVVLAAQA
jgi:hypothetical protein